MSALLSINEDKSCIVHWLRGWSGQGFKQNNEILDKNCSCKTRKVEC